MTWIDGRIVEPAEARLAVADRSLEHGLGLFETMRAVDGRVPLLDRHLARLRRSARSLGIGLDGTRLPDRDDVVALIRSRGAEGCVVRLTISGGAGEAPPSAWMVTRALPTWPPGGIRVEGDFRVEFDDELARHKTLNHWRRRRLMERARIEGVDERLARTADGRFWEAIWSNVFVARGGMLMTPRLDGPVLPGIMRGLVIERARALGMYILECDVQGADCAEMFLTNALRGVVPVASLDGRGLPAPGPFAGALQREVERWLREEAG
jgi:branched-subunit amino acid aminotransferase/4-amino-4-deoxychorismate lyase